MNQPTKTPNSTPPIDFRSLYSQAVITMCWRVTPPSADVRLAPDQSYRQLVVATVELIPKYWHFPENLTVGEQGVKVNEQRLYFIQRVVEATKGLDWYEQTMANGCVDMFWDHHKVVAMHPLGEGDCRIMSYPKYPETAYLADSPIIPNCWGHAQVNHLMPFGDLDELVEFIANESVADWIGDRLGWRLNENLEYLGSVTLIAPNPYYCRSRSRLCPAASDSEPDHVQMHFDQDVSTSGLKLVLAERFNGNETGGLQSVTPLEDGMPLVLRGRASETGYAVLDGNSIIWDMQPFAPYIRSISINMGVVEKELLFTCKDGIIQKLPQYGIEENVFIAGEREDLPDLALSHKIAMLRRRSQAGKNADSQFFYYKQPGESERKIRELIHSASNKLLIVDPYFNHKTARLFLDATKMSTVKTTILCSAGGLKKQRDGTDPARELERIVTERNATSPDSVSILVSPQDNLHDRFVVIDDDEAWLLGSSLATLGEDSLSAIVIVKNPQATICPILEKVMSDAQVKTLADWIACRDECTSSTLMPLPSNASV